MVKPFAEKPGSSMAATEARSDSETTQAKCHFIFAPPNPDTSSSSTPIKGILKSSNNKRKRSQSQCLLHVQTPNGSVNHISPIKKTSPMPPFAKRARLSFGKRCMLARYDEGRLTKVDINPTDLTHKTCAVLLKDCVEATLSDVFSHDPKLNGNLRPEVTLGRVDEKILTRSSVRTSSEGMYREYDEKFDEIEARLRIAEPQNADYTKVVIKEEPLDYDEYPKESSQQIPNGSWNGHKVNGLAPRVRLRPSSAQGVQVRKKGTCVPRCKREVIDLCKVRIELVDIFEVDATLKQQMFTWNGVSIKQEVKIAKIPEKDRKYWNKYRLKPVVVTVTKLPF